MITPWLFECKSIPQYIDMRRKDQMAFETLKAELQKAFAVPIASTLSYPLTILLAEITDVILFSPAGGRITSR